ncbi:MULTISPECIES: DapH/DapD/GlmU-related protein [unclassified Thalassospira]|uniref:DapH/DapD/GlmU-related protein n=1 Tax=unclassified Thalassospira TaxID=2648997 RepID=UPI001B20CB2C|nr:DapH/DapD/GlmU-related protein [Thalassospira sp.]MBO6769741.1 hypothetical protein [Thalassospira sp.]
MKLITAKDCSGFLKVPLLGKNCAVVGPKSIAGISENSIVFLSKNSEEAVKVINSTESVVCVTTESIARDLRCTVIVHPNPRLAFSLLVTEFFVIKKTAVISDKAEIDATAAFEDGVSVGPFSVVGKNVKIGSATSISENVVIGDNVVIGKNCIIKPNTTIGASGFGFSKNFDGDPVGFPHIGNVVIGNDVEIGANCTVVRAALDTTTIGDAVKTDDHVHIAHNCIIGKRTFLAAGVVVCGSCNVGADVWISPNSTVIDYCTIGDGAFIGLGSVVRKPVSQGERVFGVPANPIGRRKL